MLPHHLVRFGLLGHVGRFHSADSVLYPRGTRVVCRTPRGLEVGEVLGPTHREGSPDGSVLRRVSVEDDLLLARLEKHRDAAFDACSRLLSDAGCEATLIDVEHLFDGESLFFYFLGDPPTPAMELTSQLAELYAAKVQFREFAETLTHGCGPGCGTEEAAGHGCTSACSSCALVGACR